MKLIAVVATENSTALAIVQMDADEVRGNTWEPFTGQLSGKDQEQLKLLMGFVQLDEPD